MRITIPRSYAVGPVGTGSSIGGPEPAGLRPPTRGASSGSQGRWSWNWASKGHWSQISRFERKTVPCRLFLCVVMQGYPSPRRRSRPGLPGRTRSSRSRTRGAEGATRLSGAAGRRRVRRARSVSGSSSATAASTSGARRPSPVRRAPIAASPHPRSASAAARPRASRPSSTKPASVSVPTATSSASWRTPRLCNRSRSRCSDIGRARSERIAVPRARSRLSSRARDRASGRSSTTPALERAADDDPLRDRAPRFPVELDSHAPGTRPAKRGDPRRLRPRPRPARPPRPRRPPSTACSRRR